MKREQVVQALFATAFSGFLPACGKTAQSAAHQSSDHDKLSQAVGETITSFAPTDPLRIMYEKAPSISRKRSFLKAWEVDINPAMPRTQLLFEPFPEVGVVRVRASNRPLNNGRFMDYPLLDSLQPHLRIGKDLLEMRSLRGKEMLLRAAATPGFHWDKYVVMCAKWMDRNEITFQIPIKPGSQETMAYEFWKDRLSEPAKIWQMAQALGVFLTVQRVLSSGGSTERDDLTLRLPSIYKAYESTRKTLPSNQWGPYGSDFAAEVFNINGDWVKFVLAQI